MLYNNTEIETLSEEVEEISAGSININKEGNIRTHLNITADGETIYNDYGHSLVLGFLEYLRFALGGYKTPFIPFQTGNGMSPVHTGSIVETGSKIAIQGDAIKYLHDQTTLTNWGIHIMLPSKSYSDTISVINGDLATTDTLPPDEDLKDGVEAFFTLYPPTSTGKFLCPASYNNTEAMKKDGSIERSDMFLSIGVAPSGNVVNLNDRSPFPIYIESAKIAVTAGPGKTYLEFNARFYNSMTESLSINEISLFTDTRNSNLSNTSAGPYYLLLGRDILNTPVVLSNEKTLNVTYTIEFPASEDGGFNTNFVLLFSRLFNNSNAVNILPTDLNGTSISLPKDSNPPDMLLVSGGFRRHRNMLSMSVNTISSSYAAEGADIGNPFSRIGIIPSWLSTPPAAGDFSPSQDKLYDSNILSNFENGYLWPNDNLIQEIDNDGFKITRFIHNGYYTKPVNLLALICNSITESKDSYLDNPRPVLIAIKPVNPTTNFTTGRTAKFTFEIKIGI